MQTTIGGCEIAYRMKGEGPLLVLLHGWGANADLFQGVEAYAASTYTVVSPDLPGFGKSTEPEEPYGLDDYVNFVKTFVCTVLNEHRAGEERQQVILLGHSHGGRTLIRMLRSRDNRKGQNDQHARIGHQRRMRFEKLFRE